MGKSKEMITFASDNNITITEKPFAINRLYDKH